MSSTYAELEAEAFDKIVEILRGIIGDDAVEIGGVGRDSAFLNDLLIDSIMFIRLAESIRNIYGDSVNFADWLSGKTADEFFSIRVGDVTGFIAAALSSF